MISGSVFLSLKQTERPPSTPFWNDQAWKQKKGFGYSLRPACRRDEAPVQGSARRFKTGPGCSNASS